MIIKNVSQGFTPPSGHHIEIKYGRTFFACASCSISARTKILICLPMCFTSTSWGHQICCPGPPHWISRWPPWLVWTILGSKLLGGPLPIFRYQWLVGRFIEFKNCRQINFSACISCPFAVTANNVLGLPKLFYNGHWCFTFCIHLLFFLSSGAKSLVPYPCHFVYQQNRERNLI